MLQLFIQTGFVSDVAVFVLKRDVKLHLTIQMDALHVVSLNQLRQSTEDNSNHSVSAWETHTLATTRQTPKGRQMLPLVTGQLVHCQLADWTTRGLADAAKRTKTKHAKSPVTSAICPVRELAYPRVVQCASRPVRELSSPRVGNPRLGVSASCPVTLSLY